MNEKRIIDEAFFIIENNCTIRFAAKQFEISKSTVHKDVSYRLKFIDKNLFNSVKKVLENNFSEKHIRGGIATRKKYFLIKSTNKKSPI